MIQVPSRGAISYPPLISFGGANQLSTMQKLRIIYLMTAVSFVMGLKDKGCRVHSHHGSTYEDQTYP